MTRAEERALEFYPMKDYNKEPNYIHSCDSKMLDEVYREVFMIGYELAEKDLGWHPSTEHPPVDEEVIVLKDHLNLNCFYQIAFGHIVDKSVAIDYNGWNIEGVRYWMPMPEIPNEEKKSDIEKETRI